MALTGIVVLINMQINQTHILNINYCQHHCSPSLSKRTISAFFFSYAHLARRQRQRHDHTLGSLHSCLGLIPSLF